MGMPCTQCEAVATKVGIRLGVCNNPPADLLHCECAQCPRPVIPHQHNPTPTYNKEHGANPGENGMKWLKMGGNSNVPHPQWIGSVKEKRAMEHRLFEKGPKLGLSRCQHTEFCAMCHSLKETMSFVDPLYELALEPCIRTFGSLRISSMACQSWPTLCCILLQVVPQSGQSTIPMSQEGRHHLSTHSCNSRLRSATATNHQGYKTPCGARITAGSFPPFLPARFHCVGTTQCAHSVHIVQQLGLRHWRKKELAT